MQEFIDITANIWEGSKKVFFRHSWRLQKQYIFYLRCKASPLPTLSLTPSEDPSVCRWNGYMYIMKEIYNRNPLTLPHIPTHTGLFGLSHLRMVPHRLCLLEPFFHNVVVVVLKRLSEECRWARWRWTDWPWGAPATGAGTLPPTTSSPTSPPSTRSPSCTSWRSGELEILGR